MDALFEPVTHLIQSPQLVALWCDALLKSLVVLGFAGGVCLVWRRAAAATRHLIWLLAMATLPLLPLLPHILPNARHPLWSVSSDLVSANHISVSLEFAPSETSYINQPESSGSPATTAAPSIKNAKRVFTAQVNQNWLALGFIAWSIGLFCLLLCQALGQFQLRKFSRAARVLDTPEWIDALSEACGILRLPRHITLLQSTDNVMPLTWGWLRPTVLLPHESGQWPAGRRRVVLLHELAHIKRLDCLTQTIVRIIAALYWLNPLVWVATRQMCIERERACDDLVLNGGCKASDYAGHLVQIAKAFRRAPQMAGIAMARSSNLEQRVTAIVDASRARHLRPLGLAGVLISIVPVLFCIGGFNTSLAGESDSSLRHRQITRLEEFSKQKLQQAKILMTASGDTMLPEYQRFFDAAISGDVETVTNMTASLQRRHPQYERVRGVRSDARLRTSYWQAILEMDLAYVHVANCSPEYTEIAVNGIINSIPPGSIYFGGTDPGRGLPTAFSKSSIDADPFYTLTQNALADGSYLEYLRKTYGDKRQTLEQLAAVRPRDSQAVALDKEYQAALDKQYDLNERPENDPEREAAETNLNVQEQKVNDRTDEILAQIKSGAISPVPDHVLGPAPEPIYIPTKEDSEHCFQEYTQDAEQRMEKHQLKSGEKVTRDAGGHTQVSGQVAVMGINGLIAKVIFDKNPDREFYIEESFPLDWMYPHLEPHGLIMKINREPQAVLSEEAVQRDHEYWQNLANGMIGDWLTDDTPEQKIADFAEKVYLHKDLSGFTGDPGFVNNDFASKMFSKWRSSIAGVYAWRVTNEPVAGATTAQAQEDRERLIKEADFAFKQAFALCPYSSEVVYRYVQFLMDQKRKPDALLLAETASHVNPADNQLKSLVRNLRRSH